LSAKGIYRFYQYGYRGYTTEAVFVTTEEIVDKLKEASVYLGEIHGKHSECVIEPSDKNLKLLSDDPADIEVFERLKLRSGPDIVGRYFDQRAEEEHDELAELEELDSKIGLDDDFDGVVLEPRQCNVGDGEVCTSCE